MPVEPIAIRMHNKLMSKPKIQKVIPRMILDSRGNPTIEVDVILKNGVLGRAAVPSGASTGSHEATELRDGGSEYGGKNVQHAIDIIRNEIAPVIIGSNPGFQSQIDDKLIALDGTINKSRLGANSILAVSMASAHAYAKYTEQPLFKHFAALCNRSKQQLTIPIPMCNIFNGGRHASGSIDFQEFMIVPIGISDYSRRLRACSEIFHSLGKIMGEKGWQTTVGDEGGYSAKVSGGNTAVLDLLTKAVKDAGYEAGKDVFFALDIAASEFYKEGVYELKSENRSLSADQILKYYSQLVKQYPIISIEDGLDENDWDGWEQMVSDYASNILLVGDDLLVTNPSLIKKAISQKAANALLVKPNQIGTISETIKAVTLANEAGWKTIMSHRSGETEDTTIAHLAVGLGTDFIKTGSMSRSERLAKYNELLRIQEIL